MYEKKNNIRVYLIRNFYRKSYTCCKVSLENYDTVCIRLTDYSIVVTKKQDCNVMLSQILQLLCLRRILGCHKQKCKLFFRVTIKKFPTAWYRTRSCQVLSATNKNKSIRGSTCCCRTLYMGFAILVIDENDDIKVNHLGF